MVGAALVKAIYVLPTWTRTARLIAEHAALRGAIGGAPSHWACYRFAAKLRDHGDMLAACIDRVLATLHAAHPEMGQTVAIDGSDLPAYANRQRYLYKVGPERTHYSDPDASWGTGRRSPPARAAVTMGTSFMPLCAHGRGCRLPGRCARPPNPSTRWCRACWTR
jgi:hypothetical protein